VRSSSDADGQESLVFEPKTAFHDLGRWMYGLAGIALGVIGLVWRDFAAVWQPLENLGAASHRALIAVVFAAALSLAGAATVWRRTAPIGFLALTVLHLISALGWIPRILANPGIFGVWNGFCEQLALVSAGAVGYASLLPLTSPWKVRVARTGCLVFAACAVSFAFGHFTAIRETTSFVPQWIPPGQRFWAWATGIFHLLAGLAIGSGLQAALASRLLTTMMVGFGVLVWAPMLIAEPTHFNWAGNAINLALTGAAWVIADSIASRRSAALSGN
jgi:uncharacterized membrane protein YphA (DoxX/SURF4 family)